MRRHPGLLVLFVLNLLAGSLLTALPLGCGAGGGSPPTAAPADPLAVAPGENTPAEEENPFAPPAPRSEPVAVLPGPTPSTGPTTSSPESEPVPALPVYRPEDTRPKHDDAKLAEAGIQRYESAHLLLYTDLPPEQARPLPLAVDEAFAAFEKYFGPLPPDRNKNKFQLTGYLMANKEPFYATKLLVQELPPYHPGWYKGREFWMNDQPEEYYRRHLLLHEALHCFMTALPNQTGPDWYLEGMAELFGTHRLYPDGRVEFGVIPRDALEFNPWGRIERLRTVLADGRRKTVAEIRQFGPNDLTDMTGYAWCWALCWFLDHHPRYHERFRELGKELHGNRIEAAFDELFGPDLPQIEEEFVVFTETLQYGHDLEHAAITFEDGKPLAAGETHTVTIQANAGWQSTGIRVEAQQDYTISAEGQFTLNPNPKPWISEPQGVSIRYHDGRPLGMLLGAIHGPRPKATPRRSTLLEILPIGRGETLPAPRDGTLYLRVNDSWSEIGDNTGEITVEIRRP